MSEFIDKYIDTKKLAELEESDFLREKGFHFLPASRQICVLCPLISNIYKMVT